MRFPRPLVALALAAGAVGLSGCAQNFTANVARFQRLPQPAGQTFRIEPANPRFAGGLEFASYASLVANHLAQLGYRPSQGGGAADMIVSLDYGVGAGQQKVVTTPGFDCGWGGWGGGWGGWGGGWGGWGGPGWRYGWGGPYGGFGGFGGCPDVNSYTVYQSQLTMNITRADGARLFEGRARAHSTTDNLTVLVPNLIDAMFTGFPGNSGQDIRITVSPDQQKQNRAAANPAAAPMAGAQPTS